MQIIPKDFIKEHPCFNEEAHDRVGRVHLPVAPKCNIQCNFCERKVCMNVAIQHPGWTAKVISPSEALDLVRSIVKTKNGKFVIGVAGPGDPLANEATFKALNLIHREYPGIMKCMSTNGLLLADKLSEIVDAGITALTVTVNAANADIGQHIYSWVRYAGKTYRGREAAELLIVKQIQGIKKAVDAGIIVKINTVFIPGVNDEQMTTLASRLRDLHVNIMNIMPLIPSGKMRDLSTPTCEEINRARQICEAFVTQFHRCEHCRADLIYIPNA
jgi:nitrogen fixation protein NifB